MTPDDLLRLKDPDALTPALRALWWDAHGDWTQAHKACQEDEDDPVNAWVHAYLHRKEGDLPNARYWYREAGKPEGKGDLAAEWRAIAAALLK